jgi:hypothetical protein
MRDEDGRVNEIHHGPKSSLGAFVPATHEFIFSDAGEIIDLSTGQNVGRLPFPQKEYPDPDG